MVMAHDVAKIGDLGIAKLLKQTMAAKTQIGTPHYMPPEIWKNRWAGGNGEGAKKGKGGGCPHKVLLSLLLALSQALFL